MVRERAVLELGELPRAGPDEPPRDARAREAERFGDGLGRRPILARRDAGQDAAEEPHVPGPRCLEGVIRRERHVPPHRAIAHARDINDEFLIGEKHGALLRPPPHEVRMPIPMRVAGAGEPGDFLLQRVLDRPESERNESLDHRDDRRVGRCSTRLQRRDHA